MGNLASLVERESHVIFWASASVPRGRQEALTSGMPSSDQEVGGAKEQVACEHAGCQTQRGHQWHHGVPWWWCGYFKQHSCHRTLHLLACKSVCMWLFRSLFHQVIFKHNLLKPSWVRTLRRYMTVFVLSLWMESFLFLIVFLSSCDFNQTLELWVILSGRVLA